LVSLICRRSAEMSCRHFSCYLRAHFLTLRPSSCACRSAQQASRLRGRGAPCAGDSSIYYKYLRTWMSVSVCARACVCARERPVSFTAMSGGLLALSLSNACARALFLSRARALSPPPPSPPIYLYIMCVYTIYAMLRVCVCVCMCVHTLCVCVCRDTHTQCVRHTHTHTPTHTQSWRSPSNPGSQ
jgi:hypothetical protein